MKRIGILDADMLGRKKHRFPNLACMKISGYHKSIGDEVSLITEYFSGNAFSRYYNKYDKIYVSKVFVDTPVPYDVLNLSITEYGGTGFFYANAEPLPDYIEHSFPDYHLYDEWIDKKINEEGFHEKEFIYYKNYSIGFMTRKCVRGCKFCVNQHSTKVEKASPVIEFLDESRPNICLLDDNILAYENWKDIFEELNETGKIFEFKQGLDIRALNEEKAETIMNSNNHKTMLYFAFDNIKDKDIIEEKLKLWKKYHKGNTHMYILAGFDEDNKYDYDFWSKNVVDTLERIRICIKYRVYPYIMKYRKCNTCDELFRGMYINMGSWCNQRSLFAKWTLNEWANEIQKANEKQLGKHELFSSKRYLFKYAGQFPDVAYKYFDMKFDKDTDEEYKSEKYLVENAENREEKDIVEIKNILIEEQKEKNGEKIVSIPQIELIKDVNLKTKQKRFEAIKNKKELTENIFTWFKSKIKDIKDGVVVKYNPTTVNSIKENSINLILVNIKDEIEEDDLGLLKRCEEYLNKTDGLLYIFNSNIKTFNTTKEFLTKNTSLNYNTVLNFKDGANNKLCSFYSYNKNSISWDTATYKDKNVLTDNIILKSSKDKDIILSFFNRYDFIQLFSTKYNNRTWICVKKANGKKKHSNIRSLSEDNSQISLLESKDQDIS